jgi:hypothetical protein
MLQVWDFFLIFHDEVNLIWKAPWSYGKVLYLFIRLIGFTVLGEQIFSTPIAFHHWSGANNRVYSRYWLSRDVRHVQRCREPTHRCALLTCSLYAGYKLILAYSVQHGHYVLQRSGIGAPHLGYVGPSPCSRGNCWPGMGRYDRVRHDIPYICLDGN